MPHNKPNYVLSSKRINMKTPITTNPYKLPFLRQQKLSYLKEPQTLSPENGLESIPDEILGHIFSYLQEKPHALAAIALTSRRLLSALMQPVRHGKSEYYYPFLQLLLEAESKTQLNALLNEHEITSEEYLSLLGLNPGHNALTHASTLLPVTIFSYQVDLIAQNRTLENTVLQKQKALEAGVPALLLPIGIGYMGSFIIFSVLLDLPPIFALFTLYQALKLIDTLRHGDPEPVLEAKKEIVNKINFFRNFKDALPKVEEIIEEENTYCNNV